MASPHSIDAPGTGSAADSLVMAFYAGLGSHPAAVTLALQRRDVAIARQLVAAGATPKEAEAWARETGAAPQHLAPVDLRSFERERLGWLARQRASTAVPSRVIDRTGQRPSWQTSASDAPPSIAPRRLPNIVDETRQRTAPVPRGLAGERIRESLSELLRGGGP
jgi:hypothetical protein